MNNNSHILLFIDARVQDYQYLTYGVKNGTKIFLLHPEVDGIKQITNTLSQYKNVESIHIVSHGAPGTIYLGDTQLNRHTLKDYVSEIETWFSSTADYQTSKLYLYGCDVATTDAGSELLEKLHQLTKATVYASSTPVGNSNLGGNWDLDICYGAKTLDSPALVFHPQVLATYAGIFAVSTGNDGKYTYYDSTDSSGKGTVTFNDIKGTTGAQKVTFSASFNGITAVPTADFFSFNFYGDNFTQINIAENGALIFGNITDTTFTFNNSTLPSTNSNAIFPFWDDLGGGEVYYKKDGDRFIVQWSNFADGDDVGSITFQVILYQNSNNIEFVYPDALFDNLPSDYGKSATIGLNKSSSSSLTYSYNQASLNGVTSIRFVTEPRLVTNNFAVTEGETIVLTANNFNATDIDNTDLSKIKYTITNTTSLNGEFQLNNSPTQQFTQQDINDGKVKFVHNGGEDAPSFSITVSDGVNSTNAQAANIQFTKVNDIPTLTGFVNTVSFAENSLNAAAAIINSSVTLNDVDSPDFNSGNLTVIYSSGNGQPEDQLSIRNTTSINFSNGIVSFNGNPIGTVDSSTNGSNGKSLVINFNSANATLAAVKALIENLTYQNTSHTPSASRTISVTVNDGDGGTSIPATTTINITAENDAPVNNILGTQPIGVNEDETLTFSGNNLISISDPDAGNNSIKVKLEATNGTLSLNGITGLDFTGGAGDGTDDSTLEFKGSLANINQALNGMTFKPNSNYNGSASVKITTDDLGNSGTGNSLIDTDTINITVNPVNDAPVNSVPSQQTVDEDTDLIINGISIGDVDINNTTDPVTVTLAVNNGVLTLSSTTGLTFANNTSNGQGTISVTGKLADINSALNGLTYRGLLNYNGEDTLTITTNDLGNIGIGGFLPDTDTVKIQINAVNDAPVNSVPSQQTVDEDTDLVFSTANNNLISISDVDINNTTDPVTVTLAVSNGVLTLSSTTGLTFEDNTSNGQGTITVTGTLADINTALDGLTYRGLLNYNGEDTLTITTNDNGNIGKVSELEDTDTVKIQINAVNDAPVNSVPSQQTVDEDTDLVFSTANNNLISISDVDINNTTDPVTVTLAVSNGVLTLSSTTGLTFEDNTSNGQGTITVTGTLADINTALDGLTYRASQNYNGEDTLTITTNDLGNIGKVSELEDTDTVKIQITAVNDAPVNTVPSQQTVDEDTDLVFNTANNNLISIGDVDINNTTDSVTVTLAVSNGVLTLSSTTGLTFEDNTSNGQGTITVTGTLADINTALDGLTYRGLLNYNGEDTLTITTNDNGNIGKVSELEDSDTVKIQINAVNDPPFHALVPEVQSVKEDTDLVFNVTNQNAISISDVDVDGDQEPIVGELQVTLAVNHGKVTLGTTTDLTFDPDKGNGSATIIFTGSLENINAALAGLIYRGDENFNGEDSLTITVNDQSNGGIGGDKIDQNIIKINVQAVNDKPINTIPSNQIVDEDSDLVFSNSNSNAISISDVDFNEAVDEAEVQLSVTHGLLTLRETVGLTLTKGDTNGSATITLTGKLADINSALDGLTYQGNPNFYGEDTLTIKTSDLGNRGNGEVLIDESSILLTVNPVNDAPVNTIPQQQQVDQYEKLIFSAEQGNVIRISDVDINPEKDKVEVTVAVSNGTLTLAQLQGLNFIEGKGAADAKMTFNGKLVDVNKALNGMFYLGNKDFSGADNLTITTSDLGNFGADSILYDQDTIDIKVIPDLDKDGISNLIEKKVASEIAKQEFADVYLKNLSQRSINEAGIIALFAGDNGKKQPTVIAILDQDQKQLGGNPQNPVLVVRNLETKSLEDVVKDPIFAFDNKDVKKSSLNKVTAKLNVINFEVLPDSILTNSDLQQKVVDSIQKKPIRLEINLPDSSENEAINSILLRKADGTLIDFRRQLNPQRGQLDEDLLTGVVLQDRNLDGKADWAVVYLQDGQWGDTDGLSNGKIEQSLVAVNWDLGAKRMEVGSNQGRLNFQGNRSHVQFSLDRYSGVDASEIGMARVRFGDNGQIIEVNGQAVNSVDEAKQLIIQRGETVFSSLTNRNNPNFGTQTHTAVFEAGEEAVFYLIQGGSKDELLFNGLNSKPVQFSLPSLNGAKAVFQASGDESKQTAKISFAGLFDISAKILTAEEIRSQVALLAISQSQTIGNKPGELIDLKSAGAFDNQQVKLKFSIQREASQNNSAYFYRVDDTKGSILDPLTGLLLDPTTQLNEQQKQRYLELATGDRLVQNAQFETGNFITNEITITVNGGQYYAPFLVSNGTLSTIGKDYSRILSSYINMNSDRVDHIRNLGNNMFGIEDVIGGGDRDYNDMILSIKQVQVFG